MAGIGKTRKVAGIVVMAAVLGACDEEAVGPEGGADVIALEEVIGTYSAVTMTTTDDGATTDQLALGTTLDLTLRADGTTTGRLFVPDGREEGGDLDADLSGSFSFDESTGQITFEQAADTFVRNMTFTAVRSDGSVQLEGERTFGGTTVRAVLK